MPNLPISQLPPISASTLGYLSSDAEFAVAQSGTTYKVSSGALTRGNLYGSFFESSSQSGFTANVAYSVSASTTSLNNGINVLDSCKFTVSSAGTYNLQFSLQLNKLQGGSSENIDIWLSKNGSNVPDSNTRLTLANNNNLLVAAWNFIEFLNAGEFLELKISVTDPEIVIYSLPTQTTPTRPAIPSAIVTLTQI